MSLKLKCGFLAALTLAATMVFTAWADTLELKNGSLIKGKFLGGTDTEISFQVGSSVQKYIVADIVALKFDSEGTATTPVPQTQTLPQTPPQAPPQTTLQISPQAQAESSLPDNPEAAAPVEKRPAYVTFPAGTRITVRTIDAIDSNESAVGDRFQASLEEPLNSQGLTVVARDAFVYGRLTQAQQSGTFAGRSQLRLELTGIVVNGKTVSIVTGEYEARGRSRAASTARRTAGGAALGAIIGAAANGGEGAAIGAGIGATAGATSEIIIGGDQVRVPSETLLDFTLLQDLSIPAPQS